MDEQITLQGEDATLHTFTLGADTDYGEPTRTYDPTGTPIRVMIEKLTQPTSSLLSDLGTGKPSEPGYVIFFKTSATGVEAHVRLDTSLGLLELTEPIRMVKQRGALSHTEAHASKVPEAP